MSVTRPVAEHVVVIGRGILGLTTALRATQRGLRTSVVGRPATEAGWATGAAGAMLGTFGEVTSGVPPELDAELEARVAASGLSVDLLEELGDVRLGGRGGTTIVASARSTQDRRNLQAIRRAVAHHGARAESVDPDELLLQPAREHPIAEALHLPDESWVDAPALVGALESRLRSEGVTFVDEAALEIVTAGSRVHKVRTDRRQLGADALVLAAGAATTHLLGESRLDDLIPAVYSGKGTSLVLGGERTPSYGGVVRTPNRAFACGVHLVPRSPETVYLGATNRFSTVDGATGEATAGEVHLLLQSAIHELDTRLANSNVVAVQHGARPISADGLPIVGATRIDGLHLATGTYRNGVLLAPLVANAVIAGIVGDEAPTAVPSGWSPTDRPTTPTAAQILEGSAGELVELLLEPGGSLPYDHPEQLQTLLTVLLPHLMSVQIDGRPVADRLTDAPLGETVPELLALLVRESNR